MLLYAVLICCERYYYGYLCSHYIPFPEDCESIEIYSLSRNPYGKTRHFGKYSVEEKINKKVLLLSNEADQYFLFPGEKKMVVLVRYFCKNGDGEYCLDRICTSNYYKFSFELITELPDFHHYLLYLEDFIIKNKTLLSEIKRLLPREQHPLTNFDKVIEKYKPIFPLRNKYLQKIYPNLYKS